MPEASPDSGTTSSGAAPAGIAGTAGTDGSGPPAPLWRRPEVLAAATVVVPSAVDLLAGGDRRLLAWPANDAFYYLQVGRQWAATGLPSFDGEHATNGFHPLWQAVVAAVQWCGDRLGVGPLGVLWALTVVGLALLGYAAWRLGTALRTARDGRLGAWFVLAPLGAYGAVLLPLWAWAGGFSERGENPLEGPMPMYGTWWSWLNGMETPLVLALFAALCGAVVRGSLGEGRRAVLVGGLAGAVTLARLDVGLVVAPALALLTLPPLVARRPGARREATAVWSAFGALVVAYLVVNRAYAGSWLPVSGTLKSTFPRPTLGNFRDLRSLATLDNTLFATLRLYRQAPVVLPALAAVAHVAVTWRRGVLGAVLGCRADGARARWDALLLGLAFGVVSLAAYDHLFVPGFAQGHWYWPVSSVFVTLAVEDWAGGARARAGHHQRRPSGRGATVGRLAGAVVLATVAFLLTGPPPRYHERTAAFVLDEAPRTRAAFDRAVPPLLAIDDGVDVWALGTGGLSGIGLMLDAEALDAYQRGELLALALDRGIDHVSSPGYLDATGLTPATPSIEIAERLAGLLPGQALEGYEFRVVYRSPPLPTANPSSDGTTVVIAFRRA